MQDTNPCHLSQIHVQRKDSNSAQLPVALIVRGSANCGTRHPLSRLSAQTMADVHVYTNGCVQQQHPVCTSDL